MRPVLHPGVILSIAAEAGIELHGKKRKTQVRCPFHEDQHPSAFLDAERNAFYCSVCTPGAGWSAKRFAEALHVPWPSQERREQDQWWNGESAPTTAFTPDNARATWSRAWSRARDDDRAHEDRAVYDYLRRRGIGEASEDGLFGILAAGMDLPEAVATWPSTGHQLVVPLYDSAGGTTNIQARAVTGRTPKTLFPNGSRASGTVFASASGLEVLRGTWRGVKQLVFGEGLTDFLALASISSAPVLCAPGTSMAVAGIGPWARGFELLLAVDCDAVGQGIVQPMAAAVRANGATRVRRVEWPSLKKDACEVVEQVGLEGLARFLNHVLGDAKP